MDFYRFVTDEERTIEAAWQQNLRKPLLDGRLPLQNLPQLLPTAVKVFLCSVASDSECEREYLINNVYIKLREYCRAAHGTEFQVVDLRSGLDRQSQHVLPSLSQVSKFEIQQCQSTSAGPYFVALIGQRYCNEAIPPSTIDRDKLLEQKKILQLNGHDISLLERYYKLDENVSPPLFLLQPALLANTDKWVETERTISELLMQAADYMQDRDWSNPPSDLQTEMNSGIFFVEKQKSRDDNCLIMKKAITDLHQKLARKRASKFIDINAGTNQVDKEAGRALADLTKTAESYLTTNNIFHFNIKWSEPAGIASHAHKDYLVSLGNTFFEQVRRHIDINMIEWGHYPDEELYVEVQQHWLATRSNLEHFYEQGQHIHSINEYVFSQSAFPLFVHGTSGCGKSSILSHIAATACDNSPTLRVILRHLGYTPASSDVQQLLLSLIRQLCEVMGMSYVAPKTFLEAKVTFRNILESGHCNCTLLLVIDGLERLSAEAYDLVDWLPQKLSPNVKLIVSMRDSDSKGTLVKVQNRYAQSTCFVQICNLIPETCEWIMKRRLQSAEKTVTDTQWKVISKCLHECPYPLYLQLVFQQAKNWRSFDHPYLPSTIPGLCDRFLDILETRHGQLVVSHVLSIFTRSLYGLSEAEIEDILSLDDELLSLYATPVTKSLPVLRVPCLVWSRLKQDLMPYLSVWKVDGVNLITWRYDQLAEAVSIKYLSSQTFATKIHSLLADFFLGKWSGINKKPNQITSPKNQKTIISALELPSLQASNRNVISQPLVVSGHGTDGRVNVRKLNELAHHLARSKQIDELRAKVLFSYDWMHTKLSFMPMARLLADFDIYSDEESSLVRQALSDIKLQFSPEILGVELAGRLLPYYSQHPNIKSLIDQCDSAALRRCSLVPKLQLYQSPGSFLQHGFEGALEVNPTLQLLTISKSEATYFVEKHQNRKEAVMRDVTSHEHSYLRGLPSEGLIYVTLSQERIISKRGQAIECYQIDSQQKEFSIATENGPISCCAVSDAYFIFSIKQKTGPFVCDLKYPSLVHTFKHHSTAIAISDDCEIMMCNDGQSLFVYELPLMTRHCVISTDDIPTKVVFLSNPNKFCVLSSSHYLRLYTIDRHRKSSACTVIVQEPSVLDFHLSPDKSQLLLHSKKYLKVFNINSVSALCTISGLSHKSSAHDFVAADFNFDGAKVVAARERTIGVFDSQTGVQICQAEVPFPCDIWSCLICPKMNKALSVLQNGLVHVWNVEFSFSDNKHKNNFYPGEVTSFSVSRDGSKMAVCNMNYPDAKVVDCDSGNVELRLYDSFAAGSQPLSVQISPCGQFVVTSCANDIEGSIDWCKLRSNYVWSCLTSRVSHFFVNCYSVTFSADDKVVLALSCVDYTPADPSNKFFVALCYQLKGTDLEEHKVTLPDGDIIGEPLVYAEKKWMVCLVQPCIKTKFSGMLMEQRVDNMQLYVFDIFTSSARDRKFVNCWDLVDEKNTFFVNMRETDREYQLLLLYARGKLPPYKEDGTVDIGFHMRKGMLLYDLLTSTVSHHVTDYLDPHVPADQFLISSHLQYAMHGFTMYDGKSGKRINSIENNRLSSISIAPVIFLDGHYMCVISDCHSKVRIVNTRNGMEKSHFLLHGKAVDMQMATDDRTLFISTEDGRVLVMVIVLESCDPITMVIRKLASRSL